MAKKECLDEAFAALKNFSREELANYVDEVFKLSNIDKVPIQKAIEKINIEVSESLINEVNRKAVNAAKFKVQDNKIKSGKAHLMTTIGRVYGMFKNNNAGDNIVAAQKSSQNKFYKILFGRLTREESEYFFSGKNEDDIIQALDGKKTKNPMSDKIASIINDYTDTRDQDMAISGALPLELMNNDRFLKAIHDSRRIMNGGMNLIDAAKNLFRKVDTSIAKPKWIEKIKKHINIQKTFRKTNAIDENGNIDVARVNKILSNIFDNIVNGRSEIFTTSSVINDSEALARKSQMFFHWNSWQDLFEYNKEYGKGTFADAIMSDVKSSSNKIGLAEVYGESPAKMFLDLKNTQHEVNPKDSAYYKLTDNMYKYVTGNINPSIRPGLTTFMANLRSVTSMARLGTLPFQSISDIANLAAFNQAWGHNYFKALGYHFTNLFNLIPSEERERIAKLMHLNVKSHLGYMGRMVDANSSSELMNKMTTGFFKYTGLSRFDEGNKIGNMHLMAKKLHDNSNVSWDKLNTPLKNQLSKFMEKEDWELLRKKNKGGLFTVENVENITDDELKGYIKDKDIPLYEARNILSRRVNALFDVASENAVYSPGEFEMAFIFGDSSDRGTLKGELWRTFMQFKMYGVQFIDRGLIQGYKNADANQQKLNWAASLMGTTFALSYLSTLTSNLLQGRSMPDPGLMNRPQQIRYYTNLLAPSLSFIFPILDPNNENSGLLMSLIASPSTRLIGDTASIPLNLIMGNDKQAKKNMQNAMRYFSPLQTLPIITPILQNMMGDEAKLEPGQIQYLGR